MNKQFKPYRDAMVFQMPVLGHDDPDNIRHISKDKTRLKLWLPENCDYIQTDFSGLAGLETLIFAPAWLSDHVIDDLGRAVVDAGSLIARIHLFDVFDDGSVYCSWQEAGWFKFEPMQEVAA